MFCHRKTIQSYHRSPTALNPFLNKALSTSLFPAMILEPELPRNWRLGAADMIKTRHERRKWDRIPLAMSLFVSGKDSEGQKFSDLTVARDIGGGGLLFATHRSLQLRTSVALEVPSAPWHEKVAGTGSSRKLKGRIIRVVPTESVNYYALEFDRPLITA